MENDESELGIYFDGNAAMVVGDDADVEAFLRIISVGDQPRARALAKDALSAVAGAAGLASHLQQRGGRWVQLTAESSARLSALGVTNQAKGGVLAGVLRGPKGRIDQHLKFIIPGGTPNPLMMSNAATMAMSIAIQIAVEELAKYLEVMDVKLDKLLQNDRAEAMGEIRGITRVLSEAVDMYQETGRVSSVSWDKIQHHPTSLASFVAQSVEQIDSMTEKISHGSVSDKAKAAEGLAREELSFWLAILATSMANQKRFHVLELARVNQEHPEDAEIHREIIAKHNEAMGNNVLRAVHRLSDALQRAGDLDDIVRIFLPLRASGIVESVNRAQGQIGQFVNIAKVGPLSWVDARNKGWGNTVISAAQHGGAAVGGAVAGLLGGIRNAAERAVLEQAKRIQADRAARERPENPGRDLELPDPDRH